MVANRQHQQAFELANQKMVQEAALDQAKFEQSREQFALEYGLKSKALDQNAELIHAHAEYYREAGKAKQKGMQMLNDYNVELAKQQGEAMDDFNKAGLNDPGLQAKNPVVFAKNAQDWMDEWGNSPNAQIRRNIVDLNSRIKPLNVTIPKTVQVEGEGPDRVVKGTGGNRAVSALEVIQKLQDPTQSDEMINLLDAGGYMKHTPGTPGFTPNWWQSHFPTSMGGKEAVAPTESTSVIQDPVASWLKMGKGLDLSSRKASKVPEMMAPSSAANKGVGDLRARIQNQLFDNQVEQDDSYPSAAPASLTPATTLQFGPTQQQQNQNQALSQARAALQAGAPYPAIAQRLTAMDIDPNLLLQVEPASNIFNDNSSAIA